MRTKIDLAPTILDIFNTGEIINCNELSRQEKVNPNTVKRSICDLRDDGYLINTIIDDHGQLNYKLVSKFKNGDAVLKDYKLSALKRYLESVGKIKDAAIMAADIYQICHDTRDNIWKQVYSSGRLQQREQIGQLIESHGGTVVSITLDIQTNKFVVLAKNKSGKEIKAEINAVR